MNTGLRATKILARLGIPAITRWTEVIRLPAGEPRHSRTEGIGGPGKVGPTRLSGAGPSVRSIT